MKTILILKRLFILSIFTLMISCRVTPHDDNLAGENISSNESVSVKINIYSTEWNSDINENPLISENNSRGGGNPLVINQIQSSTQSLDESSFAQIQSIPETPENEKYLADLGLDLKSASAGNLPNGAKVLILAYKKNGNTYTFHKEHVFEVGKDSDFRLNGGQNYTLIVVSTGTSYLPKTENKNNLTDAYFSFDKKNTFKDGQIVYQRIDNLIPNGNIPKNKLDIRLKKRTVGVRIVLDASNIYGNNVGGKIISIKNAKLTYRTLPITNNLRFRCGNFSRYGDNYNNKEKIVNFTESGSNNQIKTSYLVEDLMYLGDNTQVTFTAEVEVEGLSKVNLNIPLNNRIGIGEKKTFNISFSLCGAYLGPNKTNWRSFNCCNLGTGSECILSFENGNITYTKPTAAMYAWGKKNRVFSQSGNPYTNGVSSWPESENPCPAGFRVPTIYEWDDVLNVNNNPRKWARQNGTGDFIGWEIGDRLALFGYGDHHASWIWSSTVYSTTDNRGVYTVDIGRNYIDARYKDLKSHGQTVRCISKLPSE